MRSALIVVCSVVLAACASNPNAPPQGNVEIAVASGGQAVEGAQCSLQTASRRWDDVRPPTVVPVGGPDGELRVACRKAGYRDSEVLYRPSPNAYAGNPNVGIGLGGGSGGGGVGVGFGFNLPIGGAAGPVGGYPSRITVEMTPQ
jgi:hypothetical protein